MAVQPDFRMKLGDTGPLLERIAAFTDSTIQNLTGATLAFRFQLVDQNGDPDPAATPSSFAAVIVVAATGAWSYDWTSGAPTAVGMYGGELRVTIGALIQTFPQSEYMYFEIVDDLAA